MGPALVGPEASAWAAPAPCSCPGPGYSRVSLVPKLRPSPTPPTPELEPTCGTALAACPLPAMGQPGLPVPGDSGSAGVPACRPGGQPLLVSQSIGSTAQCSGPPSVSSLLAGLSFLPPPRDLLAQPCSMSEDRHPAALPQTPALACLSSALRREAGEAADKQLEPLRGRKGSQHPFRPSRVVSPEPRFVSTPNG